MRLPGPRSLVSAGSAILIVVVVVVYAQHVANNFAGFTVDDAAISYAYANNLAHGDGFRLTANASPVEGFSNPLEVLLLVPFAWVGANLDVACKVLNLGAVLAAVLLTAAFAWRRLGPSARVWIAVPCAFGFLWPTFNHWMVAGLEGGLLCGLQILSIVLLAVSPIYPRRDAALGMVALLLALTRPEGVVYGGIAVALRVFQPGRRWRPAGIFCAGFVCIELARYALFREWVANTYFAKLTIDTHLGSGLAYVHQFWRANGWSYFACLLPFFAFFAVFFARGARAATVAAFAQGVFANVFAILSGGDWMRHWRFMQPLQGPYWALCFLGVVALFSVRKNRPAGLWSVPRPALLLVAIFPLAVSAWEDWAARVKTCSLDHDVDMARIATVGNLYRRLGDRLDLGRPLLIADVDVGGMAYPPGIDVLDLGGLTDTVFGYSWTRRPAEIGDYLFLERRPDTIHTHGGWVGARPIHAFYRFGQDYRVMGPELMKQLAVIWLTAIRSDLVDPPAVPVLSAQAKVGKVQLLGFSSVEAGLGQQVLFVHAMRASAGSLPTLIVRDSTHHDWQVQWHAGYDVEPGPAGSALVGKVDVPASTLPLEIVGTDLQLSKWPSASAADSPTSDAGAMSRLPLFRLAGRHSPPCDERTYLDPHANPAAHSRGVALLASLCGGGFSRADRFRADSRIEGEASDLVRSRSDPDDRYDAYRLSSALGLPTSTTRRRRIELERARHTSTDEVALAWAANELAPRQPTPSQARAGLGALFVARRYENLLLTALSRGLVDRPEIRDLLCDTVSALGLRQELFPHLACGSIAGGDDVRYPVRALRQSFEDASDATLHFDRLSRFWRVSRPPIPAYGGEGQSFLFVPPCPKAPCGEAIWGPLPWSGRRFGVLLAGPARGTSVVVEARNGVGWSEIGRAAAPASTTVMSPVIVGLGPLPQGFAEVRVRMSNQAQAAAMTVDAPTFLDLGD